MEEDPKDQFEQELNIVQNSPQSLPIDNNITIANNSNKSNLKEPFIVQTVVEHRDLQKDTFCNKLSRLFCEPATQKVNRKIYLDGIVQPLNFVNNIVKNQKYSILTFVPVVLYNQFKYFFNLFFLLIALSQFVPALKVGLLFTYVAPLALVLFMTMCKEAWDDYKRYRRDREANSAVYKVCNINNSSQMLKSSSLRVGHIVEVNANQRVPVDLLVLNTSDINGDVFIKTDQLDGETDWKLRKPTRSTFLYLKDNSIQALVSKGSDVWVEVQPPCPSIDKFQGVLQFEQTQESLSLENTIWANSVLASGHIQGLVMFTGKETRMAMNSRENRTKFGRLDNELNYLSKLLFILMVLCAVLLVLIAGGQITSDSFILFFRYLLLLSSIIPISMRVNLDFAKLVFCYRINIDKEIEGTIARNSQIPEEIGCIQFILTDKTGTLTQNDMIFKRLSLENGQYTNEEQHILREIVKEQCKRFQGPMADVIQFNQKMGCLSINDNSSQFSKSLDTLDSQTLQQISNTNNINKLKKKKLRREKEAIIRDLITALAVCHNVTPTYDSQTNIKSYQASSPDEVALVKIAESVGISLIKRTQQLITLQLPEGQEENYEILANFPFSSESKRMGIIVLHLETNQHIFYLKGADTVMKSKIPEYQRGYLMDECESLARDGLRTLVITQKMLSKGDYDSWKNLYDKAKTAMKDREEQESQAIQQMEKDMEFLGITGVEDKLQEDVYNTLESIRHAGINVWMLTGDKIETAICISISAGLKGQYQNLYVIRDVDNNTDLEEKLNQFRELNNTILIIDGISLKLALENNKALFLEISTKAPAVVCCRVSPTQKAQITESIKIFTNKKTLAVGDGGNDVGMIQSADVGVGIFGKEGMQAALAADFSITKFKNLSKLILWHGRLSYKRSANLGQFVIHRGLIISIMQMIFNVCFNFIPIPLYNGILTLCYSTVFTMLPVFSLILDEDIHPQIALNYPQLYKSLQKGRNLNTKTFTSWAWLSIYQAFVIMILSISMFEQSFLTIQTITFSVLIISEIFNVFTQIHRLHIYMICSQFISLGIYFLMITYLKTYLMASAINTDFILKMIIITFVSWAPPFAVKYVMSKLDPEDYQKLRSSSDSSLINFRIKE